MTNQQQLPLFDEFCDILFPLGVVIGPAELHGMLCGRLCGGQVLTETQWGQAAEAFLELSHSPQGELSILLDQLYQASVFQLADENLSFQLLLPDDDLDLGQRSEALGQWCHGFLTGFGNSGIDGNQKLSTDSSEALRDIAAIVQINADDDDEEAERNYVEIIEYVRMAALNLYEEFSGETDGDQDSEKPLLH